MEFRFLVICFLDFIFYRRINVVGYFIFKMVGVNMEIEVKMRKTYIYEGKGILYYYL